MSAAAATPTVSSATTTPTMSSAATSSPAAGKRVSGQSSDESRSRSQNNHDLTQHRTFSLRHDRVRSIGNIVINGRLDYASPIGECT
jgi:Spy/CpxP family protein refolding chaperone